MNYCPNCGHKLNPQQKVEEFPDLRTRYRRSKEFLLERQWRETLAREGVAGPVIPPQPIDPDRPQ